jgi:hypothetical protein
MTMTLLLYTFALALMTPLATPTTRINPVSNSSKAGLAWGGDSLNTMNQFLSTGKVSWYYDWNPDPELDNAPIEFVPMFWGNKSIDDWTSSINQTITQQNVTAILGMNEYGSFLFLCADS